MSEDKGVGLGGGLYNDVQCMMSNGHMGPSSLDRMTDGHD